MEIETNILRMGHSILKATSVRDDKFQPGGGGITMPQ